MLLLYERREAIDERLLVELLRLQQAAAELDERRRQRRRRRRCIHRFLLDRSLGHDEGRARHGLVGIGFCLDLLEEGVGVRIGRRGR